MIDAAKRGRCPEGWEAAVAAMEGHAEVRDPYALATWMARKGWRPGSLRTRVVLKRPHRLYALWREMLAEGGAEAAADAMGPGATEMPGFEGVSPPGFSKITERMKKHKEITNPFALSWWLFKQRQRKKREDEEEAFSDEDLLEAWAEMQAEGVAGLYDMAAHGVDWAQAQLLGWRTAVERS